MSKLFPKLFESSSLGGIKLKNRIIKAPQHMGLANPDGSVTERMLQYYKNVALGGAGMIIVEYAWVDKTRARPRPVNSASPIRAYCRALPSSQRRSRERAPKPGLQTRMREDRSFSAGRP